MRRGVEVDLVVIERKQGFDVLDAPCLSWLGEVLRRTGPIPFTRRTGGNWTMEHVNVTNMDGNLPYLLAFAQDAAGEVYVLTSITTGPVGSLDTIYKIVPAQ